jgi:predicted P-loop ATPase
LRPASAKPDDGNGTPRNDDDAQRAFDSELEQESEQAFPEDDEPEQAPDNIVLKTESEPKREPKPKSKPATIADFADLTRPSTKLRIVSVAFSLEDARRYIEKAVLEKASTYKLVELFLDFSYCGYLDDAEIEALGEMVAEKAGVEPQMLSDLFDAQAKAGRKRTAKLKQRSTQPDISISTGGRYMDAKITLASNLANAMLALEQESELRDAFGYDEMLRTEVLLRPLFGSDPNFKRRPVTDADVARVQEHLHWLGMKRLGKDTTHDAINTHARAHAFHPIRDYLDALKWDGTGRVGTWLATYLGAEQTDYTEQVGTMFLIAMVARIYQPGCKVDYMPILEGLQGWLKSQMLKILAGEEYFSDQLPDITTKDASMHLRGKWLVEVAELRAYTRADVDHFKAFLTRTHERYRPSYGRREVVEPRQCVFMGTTNKQTYLRDETGNRRYWPFGTSEIDLDALRRDRDQLFAEAVSLYRGGQPWWPDREFEQAFIVPEQEARFETDIWEDKIAAFLATKTEVTLSDIAKGALGVELNLPTNPDVPRGTPLIRLGTADQRRITAILSHLKWERGGKDARNRQLWVKRKS